jgi:hypothetical protein
MPHEYDRDQKTCISLGVKVKAIAIALTVGLVALAAYSYRLTQQLHEERAHSTTLTTRLAAVTAGNPDAAAADQAIKKFDASRSVPFSGACKATFAQEAAKPVTEVASAAFPSAAASLQGMQARLRDPAERAKLKEEQIAMAKAMKTDVAEALGMDAATYERFQEFLAEQYLQNMERANPNDLGPLEGDRDINDRIAAEFGSDVAARFKSYNDNEVGNIQMKDVLGPFAEADVALSKTQRQQLSQAFTTAIKTEPSAPFTGAPENMKEMADYQKQYLASAERQNQRIVADAQNFLSASQISVLKKYLEQQIAQQRAGGDSMRSNPEAATLVSSRP